MVVVEPFDPAGNAGAVKRYLLFEQTFAATGVTVMDEGPDGAVSFMLANFKPLDVLKQPLNDLTIILSVLNAASLEVYLTKIVLELLKSPESTATPATPPTEVGNVHLYTLPAGSTEAVYLYTLALQTLLTGV